MAQGKGMRLELCGLLQAVTEPGGAGLAETLGNTSMLASTTLPHRLYLSCLRKRPQHQGDRRDDANGSSYAAKNFSGACTAIVEYLQR